MDNDRTDPYAKAWGDLIAAKRATGKYPTTGRRTRSGATRQVDFAAYLEVSQTTVSMWESGDQVPSHAQQRNLITKLEITPTELYEVARSLYVPWKGAAA